MRADLLDTRGLAAAGAATVWAGAPSEVQVRVSALVGDVISAIALGSRRAELRELADSMERTTPVGAATVLGSARGWPGSTAAFLNGCAVAADQLQDGHRPARGHPASHAVPAALAIAEELDASWGDLMSAVLAGYEVGTRIGRAMGGTPDGVHDIGTWGQVVASVATARLLAPGDAAALERAIRLSAAAVLLTDAVTVFDGWNASHAFLGLSVQHGLTAAQAAVAGLTAAPDALERHLLAVAAREPTVIEPGHAEGAWTRWEILAGYVKAFPTCAHLHGVNEAVELLLARGLRAGEIESVDVGVFAGAASFDRVADTELAARFSIPTSVAIAVCAGRLDESTLTAAAAADPVVRDLAARVRVAHDPTLDGGYPEGRPARVTVTRTDGSQRTAEVGRPRWDADRWPASEELAAKRSRLLTARFGAEAGPVITHLGELAPDMRVRDLGVLLREAAS